MLKKEKFLYAKYPQKCMGKKRQSREEKLFSYVEENYLALLALVLIGVGFAAVLSIPGGVTGLAAQFLQQSPILYIYQVGIMLTAGHPAPRIRGGLRRAGAFPAKVGRGRRRYR